MPHSLCESATRKIEHKVPPFRVYMCAWLSGSTMEPPNGWQHGNNTNSRGLSTPISCHIFLVGSICRDIGRSYMRIHEHARTHTRARAHAPTQAQQKRKAQGTQPRSRSSDLAILQRWQARESLLKGASTLALPLTTALTAPRQARTISHNSTRWYPLRRPTDMFLLLLLVLVLLLEKHHQHRNPPSKQASHGSSVGQPLLQGSWRIGTRGKKSGGKKRRRRRPTPQRQPERVTWTRPGL